MMDKVNTYDWNQAIEFTRLLSKINTYEAAGKAVALREVESIIKQNTRADVTIYDADTDEPFLVAKLILENPSYKLLMEGHVDVVSPEGVSDPFDAIVKDGIMYGRGVCDMKGGCGSQLAAFIAASKQPDRKGDIYLMFSSDEEYASQQIIKALDNGYVPKCDFVMIAEPTAGKIATGHKGNAWMDVEFQGKSAHASTPELGVNAIYLASDFITKLRKNIKKTYELQRHEIYGVPTINVGVVEGGSKPNLVAPYARICLDMRYLPQDSYDNVLSEIKRLLEECKAENPDFSGIIKEIGDWPPVIVDRQNPDLIKIHEAVNQAIGMNLELSVMAGWGEGGFIHKYGIPVVYYGPGDMKYAHAPDEQIPVNEIAMVAKGYYAAIMAVCF